MHLESSTALNCFHERRIFFHLPITTLERSRTGVIISFTLKLRKVKFRRKSPVQNHTEICRAKTFSDAVFTAQAATLQKHIAAQC